MIFKTLDQAFHWHQTRLHDVVSDINESGIGYFQDMALKTHNHFDILDISDKRVESREEADWLEKDKNAIVASIASITMTTISSTRVNAFEFGFLSISMNDFLIIKNLHSLSKYS